MTNTVEQRKRFSVELPEGWQNYLGELAKNHKLTQGEVIEILLANMHKCVGIEDALRARRSEKIASRSAKRLIKSAFAQLTPEQQRAALAAAGATGAA